MVTARLFDHEKLLCLSKLIINLRKQHRWINLKCDRGRVILINMDRVIVQIIHSRDGRMTYKKNT